MEANSAFWNFGQWGSALLSRHEREIGGVTGPAYIYPPKGLVVVAITALFDTKFKTSLGLVSEFDYGEGGNYKGATNAANFRGNLSYITTEDGANTESAHEAGDFQVTGCKGTGALTDQLTLGVTTESHNIRVGQIIESCEKQTTGTSPAAPGFNPLSNSIIPRDLENPIRVKAFDGNATVTMTRQLNISATANLLVSFYNGNTGQGFGGDKWVNDILPKGMTIYGRWTQVGIQYNSDGMGIICYFGPNGKGDSYGYNKFIASK